MIYLDFDGVLFLSDFEPFDAGLEALGVNVNSLTNLNDLRRLYLLSKPSICNAKDLYLVLLRILCIPQDLFEYSLFKASLVDVRTERVKSGAVHSSFKASEFTKLLLSSEFNSEYLPVSVLTSRDKETASYMLSHFGFPDNVSVFSTLEAGGSKSSLIKNQSPSCFFFVDDLLSNLVSVKEHVSNDSNWLIHAGWGYGEIALHPTDGILQAAKGIDAFKLLTDFCHSVRHDI